MDTSEGVKILIEEFAKIDKRLDKLETKLDTKLDLVRDETGNNVERIVKLEANVNWIRGSIKLAGSFLIASISAVISLLWHKLSK